MGVRARSRQLECARLLGHGRAGLRPEERVFLAERTSGQSGFQRRFRVRVGVRRWPCWTHYAPHAPPKLGALSTHVSDFFARLAQAAQGNFFVNASDSAEDTEPCSEPNGSVFSGIEELPLGELKKASRLPVSKPSVDSLERFDQLTRNGIDIHRTSLRVDSFASAPLNKVQRSLNRINDKRLPLLCPELRANHRSVGAPQLRKGSGVVGQRVADLEKKIP